jgi:hypothetical protein
MAQDRHGQLGQILEREHVDLPVLGEQKWRVEIIAPETGAVADSNRFGNCMGGGGYHRFLARPKERIDHRCMLSENLGSRKLGTRTFRSDVLRTVFIRELRGLIVRLVRRVRHHFRIRGQAPTVLWKQNDFALARSINEALSIAQKYGIAVVTPGLHAFSTQDDGCGRLRDPSVYTATRQFSRSGLV